MSTPTRASVEDVLDFVLSSGFLHWSDAGKLGMTAKGPRVVYQKHCDRILAPVLEHLETMVGSNRHSYCEKVFVPKSKRECTCCLPDLDDCYRPEKQALAVLDPRFDDGYESWTTNAKCRRMVEYLFKIITNMRNRFCFRDPSNPKKAVAGGPSNWCMGSGHPYDQVDDFFHEFENRSTLALNIAVLTFAHEAIGSGDDYYFNDIFLGKKDAYFGGGSCFGTGTVEMIYGMMPLRSQDFAAFLRGVYPSAEVLDFLGPALTSKIILLAPFFRWVPPENGAPTMLLALPTELEELTDQMIRERGLRVPGDPDVAEAGG